MPSIYFFNTLTGEKEKFLPSEKNTVKMYSCGPTVYDYAHIGNFRTNIFQDLLVRFLRHRRIDVIQVMNITDVDDKTIAGSIREKVSLGDYTAKYTAAFLEDLASLRISKPTHMPRATECIKEMQDMIATLISKGHAYESNGSVYFKIASFPNYGKLSKKDLDGNKQGARIESDENEKGDLSDFVLWKAKKEGEPSWPSPWGEGRPGWHIECSAMSMKYFGTTFDIHTGGEDLVFPHHENEVAQSEACTGKQFVRVWMHGKFLLVNGEKMSKSKGNFYTLRDLTALGHDPVSVRYALFSHNYRHPLNFTLESVEQAKKAVQRINEWYDRVRTLKACDGAGDGAFAADIKTFYAEFDKALCDDLNIAEALAVLFDAIKRINLVADQNAIGAEALADTKRFAAMVETIIAVARQDANAVPAEVMALIEQRLAARARKDFKESDRLRDAIAQLGWTIKDTKDGYKVDRIQ